MTFDIGGIGIFVGDPDSLLSIVDRMSDWFAPISEVWILKLQFMLFTTH